jgi:hypothetical protein
MRDKRYLRRFILAVGIGVILALVGCSGGGGDSGSVPTTGSTVNPGNQAAIDQNFASARAMNLIALHDSGDTANYNSDCISCHGSKASGTAADGRPDAHAVMMPWSSGDTTNEKCVWCHKHIGLEPSIQSGAQSTTDIIMIRQAYSTSQCLICHGLGTEEELYAN